MDTGKRIVICGGGAIGAAIAWFLSRRGARPVVVEAESSKIGARVVPPMLWRAMQAGRVIELSAPVEARARHTAATYTGISADAAALDRCRKTGDHDDRDDCARCTTNGIELRTAHLCTSLLYRLDAAAADIAMHFGARAGGDRDAWLQLLRSLFLMQSATIRG